MFPPVDPTRRQLLSVAATGAVAAAIPTVAAATPTVDAELVALSRQFEALVDKYYDAHRHWSRVLAQAHAEQDAEFGAPAARGYSDTPEIAKAWNERCSRLGVDDADDRLSAIGIDREPLQFAIQDLPANSIEALRAKALVAFFNVQPLCAGDKEYHFEDAAYFQQLFCAVADFVGLSEKVAATGYIMPPMPVLNDCDDDTDGEGEEA
jgi:hypothetical protein